MRNIRVISDDDSLQAGVLPALREYNITQFTTADVPGHQHQVSSLCGLEVTGGEAQHEGIVYHQRGCKDSKLGLTSSEANPDAVRLTGSVIIQQ